MSAAQAQPSQKLSSPWQSTNLPKIAYGKGSYLYDTTGKKYIDGSGGPAVYCLGHANEEVNNAIKAQLDRIAHGYRYTFTSDPLEQLTDFVIRRCGKDSGLNRMIFVTSGSEAVESCLKVALQYHSARGESSAPSLHRPPAQLAWQYAGRPRRLGLSRSAPALRRRAGGGKPSLARQHLSPAGRGEAGERRRALRQRAGGRDRSARRRQGRSLHLRAGGGRGRWCRTGPARLCQAHPRDLRSHRRADDLRRGHVRLGRTRHLAGAGIRWRGARCHVGGQGPCRRLSAAGRGDHP